MFSITGARDIYATSIQQSPEQDYPELLSSVFVAIGEVDESPAFKTAYLSQKRNRRVSNKRAAVVSYLLTAVAPGRVVGFKTRFRVARGIQ